MYNVAVATTEWKVHGFHEKSMAILTCKVDLSVIENDDRKILQTFITKPCGDTFLKNSSLYTSYETILHTECTGPYPFCFQACGRSNRQGCV